MYVYVIIKDMYTCVLRDTRSRFIFATCTVCEGIDGPQGGVFSGST